MSFRKPNLILRSVCSTSPLNILQNVINIYDYHIEHSIELKKLIKSIIIPNNYILASLDFIEAIEVILNFAYFSFKKKYCNKIYNLLT